jgi:hypothetical protein
MGIRESNTIRVLANGNKIGERMKNSLLDSINKNFSSSPSYFEVSINDSLELKGVQITDNSLKGITEIVMKPGDALNFGYLIDWNGKKWICNSREKVNDLYYRGSIQECNGTLKWRDSTNIIHSIPAIVTNLTLYSDGLSEGKMMILGDGKRQVVIPNNDETKILYEKQRFIVGRKVYEISHIDEDTQPGLLNIIMVQTETIADDDWTNRIAYNATTPDTSTTNLAISGDDVITVGKTATYSIINNIGYTFTWEVKTVDGTTTSYAGLTMNNIASCTVQAYSTTNIPQQIKLYAKCLQDSRVVLTKIITIKDVF